MTSILTSNPNRFVLFPIEHDDIWDMYRQAMTCFWTVEEVDLSTDVKDWESKLTADERHFITHVLAFFASSDGIINENLAVKFMNDVQIPEARCFYGFQIAMENIHSEMYSLLIDSYVRDSREKQRIFHAISTVPVVKKKADWALDWLASSAPFGERLVAFCCAEGIFFQASFCAIYWLKKRNLMGGLCLSNEFIARDEGLHAQFAGLLFREKLLPSEKPTHERVLEIVTSAVAVEKEFVSEALSVSLLGMNAQLMIQYVECVADVVLGLLGYEPHYHTQCPFDWMTLISLQGKTNFFEGRVSNYQKAGIRKSRDPSVEVGGARVFSLNEDF